MLMAVCVRVVKSRQRERVRASGEQVMAPRVSPIYMYTRVRACMRACGLWHLVRVGVLA